VRHKTGRETHKNEERAAEEGHHRKSKRSHRRTKFFWPQTGRRGEVLSEGRKKGTSEINRIENSYGKRDNPQLSIRDPYFFDMIGRGGPPPTEEQKRY